MEMTWRMKQDPTTGEDYVEVLLASDPDRVQRFTRAQAPIMLMMVSRAIMAWARQVPR